MVVPGADRHVSAQTERVELIDPGVIARLGAARIGHVRKLRPRERVERPALRTVLTRRLGSIERARALAAVEASQVSAGERCPHDAVPCDVRSLESVERMIESIWSEGPLGILVNNAEGNFIARTEELSPNAWQSVINIVLLGTLHCTMRDGSAVGRGQ